MARRPRIDIPGYHHIANRGVNRVAIFSDDGDKEIFLRILCKACRIYDVIVHDYCLMDNRYHLLIENAQENLSLFMCQVNANYAIYYNKKPNARDTFGRGVTIRGISIQRSTSIVRSNTLSSVLWRRGWLRA